MIDEDTLGFWITVCSYQMIVKRTVLKHTSDEGKTVKQSNISSHYTVKSSRIQVCNIAIHFIHSFIIDIFRRKVMNFTVTLCVILWGYKFKSAEWKKKVEKKRGLAFRAPGGWHSDSQTHILYPYMNLLLYSWKHELFALSFLTLAKKRGPFERQSIICALTLCQNAYYLWEDSLYLALPGWISIQAGLGEHLTIF